MREEYERKLVGWTGKELMLCAEKFFMNNDSNEQANFQELLDNMNITAEASEQDTATMRGSLHSLLYRPYKRYANQKTMFETLFFEYSVKINFPCVQFNVAIKQRDDFDTVFWDWRQDQFHVRTWSTLKLRNFFRKMRLHTSFLVASGVDGTMIMEVVDSGDYRVFKQPLPLGFGMTQLQVGKLLDNLQFLDLLPGRFMTTVKNHTVTFSVTSTEDLVV